MRRAVFSLYILRCADDSLYTGIATDVGRRVAEHEAGARGAKYLRGRGPLELALVREVGDRATASMLEHRVKQLTRRQKQALIDGRRSISDLLDGQSSEDGSA